MRLTRGTFEGPILGAVPGVSSLGEFRFVCEAGALQVSIAGAPYVPLTTGATFDVSTVETVADLAALNDAALLDGSNVAVASLRDFWELDTTSVLAPDGITVIATASGAGRWVRREIASEVWANQPTWFIDPAGGGSDENDGATVGTALATWAEYARRVGDLEVVFQTVTFVSDPNEGWYQVRGFHPGFLVIRGEETILDAGAFDSVQAWDSTLSPVQPSVVVDAAQDFTGTEGRMIRATSGAATGSVAWILQVGPGGTGVDTIRVSEWFDPFTFSVAVPGAGDAYDIVEHTTVTGRWNLRGRSPVGDGGVSFEDITIAGPPATAAWPIQGEGTVICWRARVTSPGNASVSPLLPSVLECYASLFHQCRVSVNNGELRFYACAVLDGNVEVTRARITALYNNPLQVVAGGQHATRDVVEAFESSTVTTPGNATPRGNSIGVCDLPAARSAFRVSSFASLRRAAIGRFWTIDQVAGSVGVSVEAYGACSWPPATVCADGYALDVGGAGDEFVVGSLAPTTAAALGATGAIDPATNAGAVRRIS